MRSLDSGERNTYGYAQACLSRLVLSSYYISSQFESHAEMFKLPYYSWGPQITN